MATAVADQRRNDFTNIRLGSSRPQSYRHHGCERHQLWRRSLRSWQLIHRDGGRAITQSSDFIRQFSAAGRATFTAGTGAEISLDIGNNINGVVAFHTIAPAAVTIRNTAITPVTLGTSNIGGNLTVNASVKQDPGSTLTVGGTHWSGTLSRLHAGQPRQCLHRLGCTPRQFRQRPRQGPLNLSAAIVTNRLTVHAGAHHAEHRHRRHQRSPVRRRHGGDNSYQRRQRFRHRFRHQHRAGAVAITDANDLRIDRLKLGSGV